MRADCDESCGALLELPEGRVEFRVERFVTVGKKDRGLRFSTANTLLDAAITLLGAKTRALHGGEKRGIPV